MSTLDGPRLNRKERRKARGRWIEGKARARESKTARPSSQFAPTADPGTVLTRRGCQGGPRCVHTPERFVCFCEDG